jgi:gas vesicle structural protein
MAMSTQTAVSRAPRPSGLADVLELILDKGLVIDAYVRVSLVGIELVTIDARIVVASVDTYLRFAEAVNRLDLAAQSDAMQLPDLFGGSSNGEGSGHSRSTDRSLEAGDGSRRERSADRNEQDRDDSMRAEAADREHEGGGDNSDASTRDDEDREDATESEPTDRDGEDGDDQTGLFGKIRERGRVYE